MILRGHGTRRILRAGRMAVAAKPIYAAQAGTDCSIALLLIDSYPRCPLCAKSGHSALPEGRYSITSSAIAITPGGIVRPSALAVLRLITSSNVVGCIIGRSAGLAPLRILPVYTPSCWYAAARLGP